MKLHDISAPAWDRLARVSDVRQAWALGDTDRGPALSEVAYGGVIELTPGPAGPGAIYVLYGAVSGPSCLALLESDDGDIAPII